MIDLGVSIHPKSDFPELRGREFEGHEKSERLSGDDNREFLTTGSCGVDDDAVACVWDLEGCPLVLKICVVSHVVSVITRRGEAGSGVWTCRQTFMLVSRRPGPETCIGVRFAHGVQYTATIQSTWIVRSSAPLRGDHQITCQPYLGFEHIGRCLRSHRGPPRLLAAASTDRETGAGWRTSSIELR